MTVGLKTKYPTCPCPSHEPHPPSPPSLHHRHPLVKREHARLDLWCCMSYLLVVYLCDQVSIAGRGEIELQAFTELDIVEKVTKFL